MGETVIISFTVDSVALSIVTIVVPSSPAVTVHVHVHLHVCTGTCTCTHVCTGTCTCIEIHIIHYTSQTASLVSIPHAIDDH